MMKKKDLTPLEKYERDEEIIRREKALAQYLKRGHGMPKTRREFLGSGVMAGFAVVGLPTFMSLFGSEAHAISAECKELLDPVSGWTPYIQVILAGGAGIHHNSLVLDSNRELLSSYSRIGLGTNSTFTTQNQFGNVPLAYKDGKLAGYIMRGLFDTAGTSVNNTAMMKFCVRSLDDKSNRDCIMGLVNAVGLRGSLLPNVYVARKTKPAYVNPSPQLIIRTQSSMVSSLSPQGALKNVLANQTRREAFLNLVNKLTSSQRQKIASSTTGAELGQLAECATGKNIDLSTTDTSSMDPRNNSAIASIWGITSSTSESANDVIRASLAMNVLNGNSGAGIITVGGYDYHGSDRATTNQTDYGGGEVIGRILATAQTMNKPVFIHVTSDGSVEGGGNDGLGGYGSDAGARGSGFVLMYDPKGRPALSDIQIGHFNSSQASDDTEFLSGWNAERCALAVFANYLQLHGKLSQLDSIVSGVFTKEDLKKLVKVA